MFNGSSGLIYVSSCSLLASALHSEGSGKLATYARHMMLEPLFPGQHIANDRIPGKQILLNVVARDEPFDLTVISLIDITVLCNPLFGTYGGVRGLRECAYWLMSNCAVLGLGRLGACASPGRARAQLLRPLSELSCQWLSPLVATVLVVCSHLTHSIRS